MVCLPRLMTDISRSTTLQNLQDLNQVALYRWSKFNDPSLKRWWVIARQTSSSELAKIWLKLHLTLNVKVNHPQNKWDLYQVVLHLWSKFGDPSLNGWWVIAWRYSMTLGRTDGHTHTDIDNNNTLMSKLASGRNHVIKAFQGANRLLGRNLWATILAPSHIVKSLHLIWRYDTWRWNLWVPGGRLNKKDGFTRYGNSHVKDKTS